MFLLNLLILNSSTNNHAPTLFGDLMVLLRVSGLVSYWDCKLPFQKSSVGQMAFSVWGINKWSSKWIMTGIILTEPVFKEGSVMSSSTCLFFYCMMVCEMFCAA